MKVKSMAVVLGKEEVGEEYWRSRGRGVWEYPVRMYCMREE